MSEIFIVTKSFTGVCYYVSLQSEQFCFKLGFKTCRAIANLRRDDRLQKMHIDIRNNMYLL